MGDGDAISICNNATGGRNRNDRNTIIFRERMIVVIACHLQKVKAHDENAKADHHNQAKHG